MFVEDLNGAERDAMLDMLAALKGLEDGTEEHSSEVKDYTALRKAYTEAAKQAAEEKAQQDELDRKRKEKLADIACGAVKYLFLGGLIFARDLLSYRIEFGADYWHDPTGGTPSVSASGKSARRDGTSLLDSMFKW